MNGSYLKLSLLKDLFVAYPSGFRFSTNIWNCCPLRGGQRLKRVLSVLNHCGADTFFFQTSEMPLNQYGVDGERFAAWLDEVINQPYCLCFFWPSPNRSIGRFYAYAVNSFGDRIVAYIKFAIADDDIEALHREINASEELKKMSTVCFRVPKCLAHTNIGHGCLAAVFEPLPPDSNRPQFGLESWHNLIGPCKNHFSNDIHSIAVSEVENERWYNRFIMRSDACSPFTKVVLRTFDSGIDVCRTHGDFACHNFRITQETLWIFDWEEFTECGPCLADEVCFFLCVRRFELGWPMEKVFQSFNSFYLQKGGIVFRQAIQSVAFLFGLKISMGKEMVDYWNRNYQYLDLQVMVD